MMKLLVIGVAWHRSQNRVSYTISHVTLNNIKWCSMKADLLHLKKYTNQTPNGHFALVSITMVL